MRQIGTIQDEENARRFGDFLTTLKIENSIDPASAGWAVWVHDDDELARAGVELAKFQANPGDPSYDGVAKTAQKVRVEAQRAQVRRARNFYDVRTEWSGVVTRARPITIGLILICVIVAVVTRLRPFDEKTPLWEHLMFASRQSIESSNDPKEAYLKDLSHGEVWRLVTPIFMHMGLLHIGFNMLWLVDLGSMIEKRKGPLIYALLVLCSAIIANIVQNYWDGPVFAGMSGVVYALFGYCWMKGRFEPQEGIGVSQQTVMLMIIWLFACMSGWLGAIANAAHVAGLLVGMLFGYWPTSWRRAKRKIRQGL
jgi:GlpG protein